MRSRAKSLRISRDFSKARFAADSDTTAGEEISRDFYTHAV